jgi:FkbM family methyltransferase
MTSPAPRPHYNVVTATRYGSMIVNHNDWTEAGGRRYGVGYDLLTTGQYMQNELNGLAGLIGLCAPDPVLLDIGANIGVHSLLFSSLAGTRGQVHAFEAQRIVYQMLMGNLALNSIENVRAHCVALGGAAGQLRLPKVDYGKPWNIGGMALESGDTASQFAAGAAGPAYASQGEAVPVMALDSFNLERVDFIKLDVEGMEHDVLRGAIRTLERSRPLMQVEWMATDAGRLPLYLLEQLDYRLYVAEINLICIPAERAADITIHGLPELTATAVKQGFNLQ